MPSIYVLQSGKDLTLYVGSTRNLESRIKSHKAGKVKSTKSRRPFELIHVEEYATITQARQRENFLKTGRGREWIKSKMITWRGGRVV